ncbi:ECF-type sigma factor [Terriglobus aquaticus]|uniref:ECF-type sigma factor n=1 Tax=Terriglobus aquaticus TaxID=940139 RepID=A0ABW9KND3_9BACT|nr:ECF-type sigma factor [Terriglobus aquaticus]
MLEPGGAISGAQRSLDSLMPVIYEELHRVAAIFMSNERRGHTLQPTALISEAYLRLLSQHSLDFSNRAQVIGVAAQMMRRILRTHQEKKEAGKRGGEDTTLCLSETPEPAAPAILFSEVDELLDRLAKLDERQARVVELRIFGGLSVQETADFLQISTATANRDWASGRLWLAKELSGAARHD